MNVAARTDFNVVSLCAGGGGLDLGIRLAVPGARTVCYVEHDVTEAGVLGKGIEAGALDDAPIWSDLLTFDSRAWRDRVDCVAGGFPCQPHSFAGKRLGEFDPRNLWPAVARVVFDIAPNVCFFENVPGILAYYWRDIRPDLQALGYEVAEGIFSAEAVGAPHLRERLYFMAYRKGGRRQERGESPRSGRQPDGSDSVLVDATSVGRRNEREGHDSAQAGGQRKQARHSTADVELERRCRKCEHLIGSHLPSAYGTFCLEQGCWCRNLELAYALDGAGGPEHEQQHGQRTDVAGRGGNALANAIERGPSQSQFGRPAAPVRLATEASDSLGEPNESRHPRDRCASSARFAFPPGPGGDWHSYLRERPGTEPAVRRGSDGLAWRADRLRVLGNGVVPVVAADAFLTLAARLGVEL